MCCEYLELVLVYWDMMWVIKISDLKGNFVGDQD